MPQADFFLVRYHYEPPLQPFGGTRAAVSPDRTYADTVNAQRPSPPPPATQGSINITRTNLALPPPFPPPTSHPPPQSLCPPPRGGDEVIRADLLLHRVPTKSPSWTR